MHIDISKHRRFNKFVKAIMNAKLHFSKGNFPSFKILVKTYKCRFSSYWNSINANITLNENQLFFLELHRAKYAIDLTREKVQGDVHKKTKN